jgi:very-short-patch-repair endonuclease
MRAPRDNNLQLRNFARNLRKSQTDAEAKLWSILRSRQLSGFKFRRQYPLAGYIIDFYCVREKFVVELDGGQHAEPVAQLYDSERTERLSNLGIRVVRYPDDDVLRSPDVVLEDIYLKLTSLLPSPQPSPGIPGEGERA